jgi:mRNA-degrading endonuclease toxin of MazEF toxin-antitoxin module
VVDRYPRQDEIWVVLDPTRGVAIQKTRPCLVVSPDEMNEHLRTAIVAPMTTVLRPYPSKGADTLSGKARTSRSRSAPRSRLAAPAPQAGQRVGAHRPNCVLDAR